MRARARNNGRDLYISSAAFYSPGGVLVVGTSGNWPNPIYIYSFVTGVSHRYRQWCMARGFVCTWQGLYACRSCRWLCREGGLESGCVIFGLGRKTAKLFYLEFIFLYIRRGSCSDSLDADPAERHRKARAGRLLERYWRRDAQNIYKKLKYSPIPPRNSPFHGPHKNKFHVYGSSRFAR